MATTEDPRARSDSTGEWKRELYGATPERDGELFTTISGLENEPLYTPDNVKVDYDRDLGYPGVYPFTRGVYPSMYRGKLWTMRQFAGFGTAEETNERFRYLLEHGQTGLSTAFDMPTLMGYDSDHARSLGEVGREGVAIDSLADMETLFGGIPLGEVSTSMTINGPAAMVLAFYVCVAEQQGVARSDLRGTIQTDILKEEIAQYRAARRIWARELRDRYGAKNPRSWLMRFHTQTAGVSLTAQQPEVNIVRTALEALAAVLGGTQSLHTNSFDEALALPTEDAVRIALRTQQVIAHETGVVNSIDPLGGSYYLEQLTNRLETEAYEYFERILELGGVVAAIKEHFLQREIADASFRYQAEVEASQRVIVGVNRYELEDEPEIEILR